MSGDSPPERCARPRRSRGREVAPWHEHGVAVPHLPIPGDLAGDERQHLAPLPIEPEVPGCARPAARLEMPEQPVDELGCGRTANGVGHPYDGIDETAGQAFLVHFHHGSPCEIVSA